MRCRWGRDMHQAQCKRSAAAPHACLVYVMRRLVFVHICITQKAPSQRRTTEKNKLIVSVLFKVTTKPTID